MNNFRTVCCTAVLAATTIFFLAGFHDVPVSANSTPQRLHYSMTWDNPSLISVSDDWSGVPGIVGYRGDDLTTLIGTDPRTILADGASTPVDINANQTSPDTFATGGVSEFGFPFDYWIVALQGSATADAPHLVIHLNTTGRSSINFSCLVRDIDASADDAIQQVDVQYRVGGTGNYTSVAGGYIADATNTATPATLITPLTLALPANADNQALVEIRVMTTNAVGNDEHVGIDNISITGTAAIPGEAPNDLNGDGKSDYVVVRDIGGGSPGQVRWFYSLNGTGAPTTGIDWGLATDSFMLEDFDGDNKDDITVWRANDLNGARFYIFNSATNTYRNEQFGLSGDNPKVIGDYDGDGKADLAVYRSGATTGAQSFWYYRGSLNNPSGNVTYVPWGQSGDLVSPGDYDGDGKFDFVIQRSVNSTFAHYWTLYANGSTAPVVHFGESADSMVPGDYDGDGKCDLASIRSQVGSYRWRYVSSIDRAIRDLSFFGSSTTDLPTQGDYDGDGKVEPGIWRPSGDPANNNFWSRDSSTGATRVFEFGQNGDYPVNNWNRH